MHLIAARRKSTTVPFPNVPQVAFCWMLGSAILTLGGCVSQQTYEGARQEAETRAKELDQFRAEVQGLEGQRDVAQVANQRAEQTLSALKSELQKIKASYEEIKKTNQAKLATLQHNIAVLRARHQVMLKEISETKRYEKKLEALTTQYERELASMPTSFEAHAATVDRIQQEPHMVAVITPQPSQTDGFVPFSPTAAAPPQPESPSLSDMGPSTSAPRASGPSVAAPVPLKTSSQVASIPVTGASPTTGTPSVPQTIPQDESWYSSMTEWLTSWFGWIWG